MDAWDALNADIIACRECPRLVAWREEVARTKRRAYRDWEYWGRPVPGFGDRHARIVIVGLAPGAHGSNRTGRMFTGDSSGATLYGALYRAGFANQPTWERADDGLVLRDVFITAVGRCSPPDNRPTREELYACRHFLERELALLPVEKVLALGRIAFEGLLELWRDQGHTIPALPFAHGARYELGDGLPQLHASYHPSRQNTQTGRLTLEMFDAVFANLG
ncbi:MAG TPA: uracil-DNA glycosylase [Anaerolineae bacterium]|nr:uracil-DNA glycosylase [Anaerolineae bacterium]